MKFTFVSEFAGFGSPKNTMEFEVDHIGDVIRYFEQFLRGSGYHFNGQLQLWDHNDEENTTQECCGGCDTMCGGDVYIDPHNDVNFQFAAAQPIETIPTDDTISITLSSSMEDRCGVCKLTREQLGDHKCYDTNCGMN